MDPSATSSTSQTFQRNVFVGLWAGVLLWGVYLAIGAVWFNLDARKGTIILACTVTYLLAWLLVMKLRARAEVCAASAGTPNRACLASLIVTAHGCAVMVLLASGLWEMSRRLQVALIIIAHVSFGLGVLAAIIGLSHRVQQRGKWMGWLAVLLVAIGVLAGFTVASSPTVPS